MQVPMAPQSILCNKSSVRSYPPYDHSESRPALLGFALSFESQIQLREIREYVRRCRSILDELGDNFNGFTHGPENTGFISKAAEHLGQICLDSDSWGFSSLYDIAFALQKTILESGDHEASSRFREAIHKSLALMSTLVEQCEIDFRRRLAIDYVLEGLDQASENQNAG